MVSEQTCTIHHKMDQGLWQTIISFDSYIHHTCEYTQYCHVRNTAKQCRLGLFQDSDFAGDLEDSKSASGGTYAFFGSHTFVPISWMCKKQASVSHSSTESDIISLDTGLRLDGLPALELWDLIVSVFGNIIQTKSTICRWTNLHDWSQNGPKPVTNDWVVWYPHRTCECKQYCHVGNTAKQCMLGLFEDSDFARDLENSRSTCAFLEVIRLLQQVGCARNKLQFRTVQQNQKSCLRMQDWGWMVSPHMIYGIWSSKFLETRTRVIKNGETRLWTNVKFVQHLTQFKKRKQSQRVINDLDIVDFISSSVNSSHQEALLHVFEDNEAVIKMIIKGRSPTLRQYRINWDPKNPNQIHRHQKPTRRQTDQGEWNHLLRLTLAISALPIVLKWCWKERKKIQVKKESQQSRDLWWILLPGHHRSYRLQLQWAWWRDIAEVKIHGVQLLKRTDRGDLIKAQIYLMHLIIITMSNSWKASLQQMIQNWMTTVLGLLKSGELRPRRTTDWGDLIKFLWEWYEKFDLVTRKFFSTEPRNP